jgi:Protein of unknown function (DUF2911)
MRRENTNPNFCLTSPRNSKNKFQKTIFKTMKKLVTLCTLLSVATFATAQVRTPQPSPAASVMQTVGITDITLKYSRPSMKGREIFGKLIPYDKVWRTGANAATSFETSTDVMVEGQKLPAGKYSIVSFPGAAEWTVVFSKNAGVNETNYKESDDALRVKVKPMETTPTYSFTMGFSDVTDSTANMDIAWEKTKVAVKLMTETTALAEATIDKTAEANANQLTNGANFLLSKGKSLDKALSLVNQAVGAKETFRNLWTKAQILGKMGNITEALPIAQKALQIGQASNDPSFGFMKDAITKGVADFTAKMPALPAALPSKKKK